MNVVILQSNYLPWKGYFDLIHDADAFIFYDEVQYTKNDWRNRNRIYSKNGLHWLTIPIAKDAVKLKISEVSLPQDTRWLKKHWQSIRSTYGAAAHFAELQDLLEPFYQRHDWQNLSALNRELTIHIARKLGCETRFYNAADLGMEGDRITRLVRLVQQVGGDHYISGPAAKSYLDGHEHLFTDQGIQLSYKDYSGYPKYTQFAEPFEHGVSVIDLIAHQGFAKAAKAIWGHRQKA